MKRLLGSVAVAIALIPGVLAFQPSTHAAASRVIRPDYCMRGGRCAPCYPHGICLDGARLTLRWEAHALRYE